MSLMRKMDVLGLLQEHGAIVPGHFQLASGLHSPVYVQTAMVLQYPNVAQRLAKALAAKFTQRPDVVVSGPSAMVLGQELARHFKCRAIFCERVNGTVALRRDFRLERGERALIVEDVLTTGRMTAEIVALARAYGAKPLGAAAIVDRSTGGLALGVPARTLISYPMEVSPPDDCPQCRARVPLAESRGQAAGGAEGE